MGERAQPQAEALLTRLAVVEAVLFVSDNDDIYNAIRHCRTYEAAVEYLAGLGMSDEQISATLAMPLSDRILASRHRLLAEAAELRRQRSRCT